MKRHKNKSSSGGPLLIGLVAALAGSLVLPAAAQTVGDDAVDQIEAAFDAAMGLSLAERIGPLEALEAQIDEGIAEDLLTGKAKADALYYKYHVQRQLAKDPQAAGTYAAYIAGIADYSSARQGLTTFGRGVNRWVREKDYARCATICQAMAEAFGQTGGEAEIQATALYHLAWARFWMNGTMGQAKTPCETLIARFPDSPWRPKAMRLLANTHYYTGEDDEALAVLALLKQQYPDTKLEHYADMRPAAVYEYIQDDPQKALDTYQQTLQRYTDHMYAPYIHRQIARLRKAIEDQLIQDALDELAKEPTARCRSKSAIVRAEPAQPGTLARRR